MNANEITRLLEGREPTLRMIPMPSDASHTGDIFGGWIISQVDLAVSIPAVRLAKGRVPTVAVNSFVFRQPVFVSGERPIGPILLEANFDCFIRAPAVHGC